MSTHTHTSVRT